MNKTLFSVLALALTNAAEYDYATNNGADWPSLGIQNNECGGSNQSPINLPSEVAASRYISPSEDNF